MATHPGYWQIACGAYKRYRRQDDGTFAQAPSAYLNLLKPRDRYPLDPDHVDGCLVVLRMLMPMAGRA